MSFLTIRANASYTVLSASQNRMKYIAYKEPSRQSMSFWRLEAKSINTFKEEVMGL